MSSPSGAVRRPEPESLRRLQDLASRGNVVPLWREVPADLLTPVGAYLRAAGPGDSFLLESVEGGERIGRWSFVVSDPLWTLLMFEAFLRKQQGH